jgi:hypothetical protein
MKTFKHLFNKSTLFILGSYFFGNLLQAQTTYTWNVTSGDFLTPSSWSPSRNTPAVNDVLVFDGNVQSNPIVNNIRTQQIGRLRIINSANVNFSSAIPDTGLGYITSYNQGNYYPEILGTNTAFVTQLKKYDEIVDSSFVALQLFGEIDEVINDSNILLNGILRNVVNDISYYIIPKLIIKQMSTSVPGLEISSGSKLQLNSLKPKINVLLDNGVFASISGVLSFNENSSSITPGDYMSKLTSKDSLAIRVRSGGKVIINSNLNGYIFGSIGIENTSVFDSNAIFEQNGGTQQNYMYINGIGTYLKSKLKFMTGSNFIFKGWNTQINGGSWGNFIYQSNMSGHIFSINNTTTIENIQVDTGQLTIKMAANGTLNIMGDIIVNSPGSLKIISDVSSSKIIFIGNRVQKIKGNGYLSINSSDSVFFVYNGIQNTIAKDLSPITFILQNKFGLELERNFSSGKGKFFIDTGAINLNSYNLTIGEDSINFGNLKINKGYVTGNGSITKWYPSNKAVTSNLDSTLFPFGTNFQNRNFWVSGNATKAGTITISHNNLLGYTRFTSPFSDSTNTNILNTRQNYHWNISTSNSLKGNNFTIKASGNMDSSFTNLPNIIRITLANSKSPGIALSGTGTVLQPLATRTNLTDSNLNNTFYLGAFSNACISPAPPTASNKTICENTVTNLSSAGIGTLSWYSDSVGGNYLGSGLSFNTPILINTTNYYVQDSTCAASVRTRVTVFVLPKPKIGFTLNNISQCINNNSIVFTDTSSLSQGNINRLWKISNSDSSTNINFIKTFNSVGIYTIQLFVANSLNNNCKDSITKAFNIKPKPKVLTSANATVICQGKSITLYGSGAKNYSWSDGVLDGIAFFPLSNKTYIVIGIDSNNCADTANINIIVNKNPSISATASVNPVCAKQPIILTGNGGETYLWSDGISNGVPFVPIVSKTYLLTALDSKGCSDTATIYVQILPLPNTNITKNKTIITATQTGATYQWLNCNTAKSIIAGATNQSYTASFNGDYAVIVTQNGCSDTSICINVNSVGLTENSNENNFSIFPNPATSKLSVTSETAIKEIYIYDLLGKLVKQMNLVNSKTKETEITIDELSAGIYIIQVVDVIDAKMNSKFIKE